MNKHFRFMRLCASESNCTDPFHSFYVILTNHHWGFATLENNRSISTNKHLTAEYC